MEIKRLREKYFTCNTYVLSDNDKAVIIDAGVSIDTIKNYLAEINNPQVVGILLTHSHFDHILGLSDYIKNFDCNVYIDSKGIYNLNSDERNYSRYFVEGFVVDSPNIYKLPNNDNIKIDNFEFRIIRTPGHTDDSVCYIVGDIMFSGDTVFDNAIGRTDLPNSNNEDMIYSLQKLSKIAPPRVVYPGHGRSCSGVSLLTYINNLLK